MTGAPEEGRRTVADVAAWLDVALAAAIAVTALLVYPVVPALAIATGAGVTLGLLARRVRLRTPEGYLLQAVLISFPGIALARAAPPFGALPLFLLLIYWLGHPVRASFGLAGAATEPRPPTPLTVMGVIMVALWTAAWLAIRQPPLIAGAHRSMLGPLERLLTGPIGPIGLVLLVAGVIARWRLAYFLALPLVSCAVAFIHPLALPVLPLAPLWLTDGVRGWFGLSRATAGARLALLAVPALALAVALGAVPVGRCPGHGRAMFIANWDDGLVSGHIEAADLPWQGVKVVCPVDELLVLASELRMECRLRRETAGLDVSQLKACPYDALLRRVRGSTAFPPNVYEVREHDVLLKIDCRTCRMERLEGES